MHADAALWTMLQLHIYFTNVHELLNKDTNGLYVAYVFLFILLWLLPIPHKMILISPFVLSFKNPFLVGISYTRYAEMCRIQQRADKSILSFVSNKTIVVPSQCYKRMPVLECFKNLVLQFENNCKIKNHL